MLGQRFVRRYMFVLRCLGYILKKRYMFQLLKKKDIQERDELLKTVKEQKQMIIDLQLRLNSVEKKLKPGPSDVDHLDNNNNLSKSALDCGLDQQSMRGVSRCMNVDEPYKVRELINDAFHTPFVQVQDACVFELLDVVKDDVNVNSVVKEEIVKDDVNVNSLVKEDIKKDDVHIDSFMKEDIEKDDVQFDCVVKDAEQIENETLPRHKFPCKASLSPYIQPPSTEVKCRKRHREIKLENVEKKSSKLLLGRMELKLNCYHGKRSHTKRGWLSTSHLDLWIDYLWQFKEPNVDWEMASPYLCDMLSRFQYPLYYADGVKYGIPWFANNVQKILLFMDNPEVFEKKNIVKDDYSISFQFADDVPIQGGLYGDCGL
nr:hypothetical protein [Tanacetum cinerariifolium]